MAEKSTDERIESIEARREFLKRAGKAAVVAPAVALLLSATAQRASAVPAVSGEIILR
jgi:hypothetical protein